METVYLLIGIAALLAPQVVWTADYDDDYDDDYGAKFDGNDEPEVVDNDCKTIEYMKVCAAYPSKPPNGAVGKTLTCKRTNYLRVCSQRVPEWEKGVAPLSVRRKKRDTACQPETMFREQCDTCVCGADGMHADCVQDSC
ncbi:pacifastin-like protease inhibitor cvp4 [Schistocerca americana]|uniref:pacifastin-like protease inhibitor cvp4 n=1 Tax=Schistocerca americana TaxID=7009 RepID=UPI001F4F65F0|nr:pacifastin-like protease inhibitor cvp4 [Schistocerca americana]